MKLLPRLGTPYSTKQSYSLSWMENCAQRYLFRIALHFLLSIILAIGYSLILDTHTARAQDYPNKSIRLVIPFPSGGATDIIGRLIGQKLSESLKQSVVIDNKPGAGGTIGTELVAKAPPDGYTLLIATSSTHSVGPALNPKLSYHPTRDFAPIIQIADAPHVLLVSATLPVKNVAELIALAKSRPGQLNFGSSGVGTIVHLTGEEFRLRTNIDIRHIPYKGTALVFPDLVSGEVSLLFDSIVSAQPHSQSNKVIPLAVTSTKRSPLLPQTPTLI